MKTLVEIVFHSSINRTLNSNDQSVYKQAVDFSKNLTAQAMLFVDNA